MAKQKISIVATGRFNLSYDPKSRRFQEALKDYREIIDKHGDAEDMLKHVAFHVNRFGAAAMVEGVGYVKLERYSNKPTEPFSGITIEDDEPDFEFEID